MIDISASHFAQISCRNSLGKILYVIEHYGNDALPVLFEDILEPDTLISTSYQYLGLPLTLDYFKNINNWYSNEVNLILFNNLTKMGIDAFDTGYYVVKEAQKTQNFSTIAYLQMLGPVGVIKKVNQLNKIYNRTKNVVIEKIRDNYVRMIITYNDNCAHSAQVTRQNLGVYTAILKESGLQQVTYNIECDDFSQNNRTILTFHWLPMSRLNRLRWFTGKVISQLFCRTYLSSDDVIKKYHSNLITSMENEIAEKEKQRKKSEDYYQQLLEQQEKKELELTQLVKVKTNELEQSIQAKDQLFENVSHELKTPLTLILGRSEQLLKTPELSNSIATEITYISTSAQQLHHLVSQLLQLAEFKSTNQVKEPIEIIQETRFMLNDLSSLAESAGSKIAYTLNSHVQTLWLSLQLGCWVSVVTNLVTNAIKYGEKNQTIDITLNIDEGTLELIVANKGMPIECDKRAKIFERFEQLDCFNQGQGLGLAIVKQLLVNHGGAIGVSSTQSENIFSVNLPIIVNQVTGAVETIPDAQVRGTCATLSSEKHQLLVVEDNQELREFISSSLSVKFKVATVEHGKAAVDWLATNILPDLILSDVMMPVMDGYQLCERLKQDPVYQYIPLFLLTAKADRQSVKVGLASAADDYIAKPFNIDVLITKITNQLATRDALKKHLKGMLLTTPAEASKMPISTNKLDKLLINVNELLAQNYCIADIKASDISKKLHMSEKTLNRNLQVITGNTISELLREYRLNQAKSLLEQGNTPKEVCFDCGFNSMSYFSRSFKDKFGYTPSKAKVT